MHILILPSWYVPQGGGFFKTQAISLRANGYKVGIVYLEEYSLKEINSFLRSKHKFRIRKYSEDGIITFRTAWLRFPFFERLNLYLRYPFYRKLVKSYINEYDRPDLIHAHSSLWGGFFAAKLKGQFQIPYVITEHRGRFNINQRDVNNDLRHWFKKPLTRAISSANKVICVSPLQIIGLKKMMLKNIDNTKFISIPNLFESDYLSYDLTGLKDSKKLVLFNISVFLPVKNQMLLVRAIEQLVKDGFKNIIVYFAGDGPTQKSVAKYINKMQLGKYFHFLGYCDKVKIGDILKISHFMVLASLTEGQPVAILESFAMGVPVIVPDLVTKEIVKENCGIIYRTGDLEALIAAILNASDLKQSFNPNTIRDHAKNFSEEPIISKVSGVYKEVLSKQH